ncbi:MULTISPECIES: glycosyltransferase [unclassified Rathayibacter]|uniref:glycosyltransferase n=1 Tax=unclassified Rathayibacter TaxID=2609250 RepID=UPI00138EE8A3|nr:MULTISPECIES: glycosyltransferase [unclassified Rathayibacter]
MLAPVGNARGLIGKIEKVRNLLRGGMRSDVIVVAEFSLSYALVAKAIAVLTRCRLVVDGFVGLYETDIGDLEKASAVSPRARVLALLDWCAVVVADLYLIDTEVRAETIRRRHPSAKVLSLPVGSPSWAVPQPGRKRNGEDSLLRVLYYGNYIPLHGVDLVIDAIAKSELRGKVELTLIGDGRTRPEVERRVRAAGVQAACRFLEAVPAEKLPDHIRESDVVLGIFGDSLKARSVIANKVWQGLSCGRTVVTRASPALEEIADVVGDQLIQIGPSSDELADELLRLHSTGTGGSGFSAAAEGLEAYVDACYGRLTAFLRE